MKQIVTWLMVGTAVAVVVLLVVAGPTRLYGLACSVECEGKVAKLHPHGESESDIPLGYVVEIHAANRQVYMFISSDVKWSLISPGDHVRSRLYPAAPWSSGSGTWQNASLISKLLPPEQTPPPPEKSQSPPDQPPLKQPPPEQTPSLPEQPPPAAKQTTSHLENSVWARETLAQNVPSAMVEHSESVRLRWTL